MALKVRYLTMPLIRPVILVITLLSITGAMKAMDIVTVLLTRIVFCMRL
ncbi:hypothetical protein [Gordoniibacillus kamchatkensis]